MADIVFKGFARTDFKNLTDVEKEQFLAVVPQELIKAIGIEH
jgi:succinate dehydrogenase flavin-adding protein (antitoxin of CptAB toxin-antitoxin module)